MKNDRLFSRPGTDGLRVRLPSGRDREIFYPEWENWDILTHTAEGGKRQ